MLTKKYNTKNKVVTLRGNNVLNSMRYGRNWKVNKVNKSKKTKTGKTGKKSLMRGGSSTPPPIESSTGFRARSGATVETRKFTHFNTTISLTFDTNKLYNQVSISTVVLTDIDTQKKKLLEEMKIKLRPIGIESIKEFYMSHLPELLKAIYKYLSISPTTILRSINEVVNRIEDQGAAKSLEVNNESNPQQTIYKYKIGDKSYELICGLQYIPPITSKPSNHYLTFILKSLGLDLLQKDQAQNTEQSFIYIHVRSVSLNYVSELYTHYTTDPTPSVKNNTFITTQINIINNEENKIKYSLSTNKFLFFRPVTTVTQKSQSTGALHAPVPKANEALLINLSNTFSENNTILNNMIIDNKWLWHADSTNVENTDGTLSDIR